MAKGKLVFRSDRCKGCELCVQACPKGVLAVDPDTVNAKGYHPIGAVNPEDCTGCANCAIMCPDGIINVYVE